MLSNTLSNTLRLHFILLWNAEARERQPSDGLQDVPAIQDWQEVQALRRSSTTQPRRPSGAPPVGRHKTLIT